MSDTPANNRYMGQITDAMINRFFREQHADRMVARASPADRNDWESAASVSEGTSQSQVREGNREDGEKKEDSANEQEEGDLDDREEDGGDNQENDENEGNHDDGEQQGDQGDAKQDGGARQGNGEDRDDADDAEDAKDSTDNNSVNSGVSSSPQVSAEDQVLPELEEAISDSDSNSSLLAPDLFYSSANQVNTQASPSTQTIPNNDDSSIVAQANPLRATVDPESLDFPFGPRAAASDSASSSSSVLTSNYIDDPSFLDNSSGVKTQFEPSTSRAKLELEERGENDELEEELDSEEDQEHGSVSAAQFSSNDAPGLVSGLSANMPTTPFSSSAAPLPFNSSQSSTPNQPESSSLLGFIPQTLRNLIANTVQPSLSSPSSRPLPASSPATPSAATPTPPNPTFWHEISPLSIPANASAVRSSFPDSWSLVSSRNPRHTSLTSSPLVKPWGSLPATDRSQASTPLNPLASAPTVHLSLRNIPLSPEGGKLTNTLASTVQQTNPVGRLHPTSPGDTTAPQQEINSGDFSALSTPSSTSNHDPSPPSPLSETSPIIFDTLPVTELESGWALNPSHFRVNRRRCPMCVRRAKEFSTCMSWWTPL